MKKSIHIGLLSILLSFISVSTFAKTAEQSITFTKGTNQKTQKGKFEGYDDVQYKIYAKKGQVLKFNVTSNNNLANINIFLLVKNQGKMKQFLLVLLRGRLERLFYLRMVNTPYNSIK